MALPVVPTKFTIVAHDIPAWRAAHGVDDATFRVRLFSDGRTQSHEGTYVQLVLGSRLILLEARS